MRILIVVPAVPFPLSSGGNTAQFGIVDQLRRRHELHYAFPVKTEGDRTALADLRRHWPDVTFHPFLKDVDRGGSQLRMLERKVRCIRDAVRARCSSVESYLAGKYARRSRQLRAEAAKLDPGWAAHIVGLARKLQCDLVQVEFIENSGVASSLAGTARTVFVHHELGWVRTERELRALGHSEAELTAAVERAAERECLWLRGYDVILTLSDEDRQKLLARVPEHAIFASPPGIETGTAPGTVGFVPSGDLAFIGGEAHYPNLDAMAWFLTSIWPQARARHPQARLRITGEWRPDTRTVLGRVPGVEFVGFVPDLAKTLAGSVLIAPVRIGSGVRIKLIQGAAFSLPSDQHDDRGRRDFAPARSGVHLCRFAGGMGGGDRLPAGQCDAWFAIGRGCLPSDFRTIYRGALCGAPRSNLSGDPRLGASTRSVKGGLFDGSFSFLVIVIILSKKPDWRTRTRNDYENENDLPDQRDPFDKLRAPSLPRSEGVASPGNCVHACPRLRARRKARILRESGGYR